MNIIIISKIVNISAENEFGEFANISFNYNSRYTVYYTVKNIGKFGDCCAICPSFVWQAFEQMISYHIRKHSKSELNYEHIATYVFDDYTLNGCILLQK